MKVPFAGGSMTAMGVNPAKFTTDNLLTQHAIENSAQYKRGLIKRLQVIDLGEEVKILKNSKQNHEGIDETDGAKVEIKDTIPSEEPKLPVPSDENKEDENKDGDEEPKGETRGNLQVEFSLNEDAKDYLEQEFGAKKAKLKNRDEIIAFAKEKGVDLIFV